MSNRGKQYIFIDDSGDPGLKPGASANFLMSAVIFRSKTEVDKIDNVLNAYREDQHWRQDKELKFNKLSHKHRLAILQAVNSLNFEVYSISINKRQFSTLPPKIQQGLPKWLLGELVNHLPLEKYPIIYFDGPERDKGYRQNIKNYIRKNTPAKELHINFDIRDSASSNHIQLADLVAGAIGYSMQPSEFNHLVYFNIIKKKIASQTKILTRK